MNIIILDRPHSLLFNAKVDEDLWAELVNNGCLLVNRSTSPTIDLKFQTKHGQVNMLITSRVFSCPAYARVSDGALELGG